MGVPIYTNQTKMEFRSVVYFNPGHCVTFLGKVTPFPTLCPVPLIAPALNQSIY